MRISLPLVFLAFLAACGQTGPLYLPDEGITTPVEIRNAPPAAAPAQPPAGEQVAPEDEDPAAGE